MIDTRHFRKKKDNELTRGSLSEAQLKKLPLKKLVSQFFDI